MDKNRIIATLLAAAGAVCAALYIRECRKPEPTRELTVRELTEWLEELRRRSEDVKCEDDDMVCSECPHEYICDPLKESLIDLCESIEVIHECAEEMRKRKRGLDQ